MPADPSLRVILVDSHKIFRAGMRKLLADHHEFAVVEDVGSGAEAIKACMDHDPDVVVAEVRLPDMSGIEMLRKLRQISRKAQVLFLTVTDDPGVLMSAAEAGAAGYVLKDISPENLANGIRAVHEGRTMIHPLLARRLFERLEASANRSATQTRAHDLKDLEISILAHVALGLSDREIAATLHVAEATVKKRLRKIYVKLGARNRAQAALVAVQNHLIPDSRRLGGSR